MEIISNGMYNFESLILLIFTLFVLIGYFIPTLCSIINCNSITRTFCVFFINLFFGWTIWGWGFAILLATKIIK